MRVTALDRKKRIHVGSSRGRRPGTQDIILESFHPVHETDDTEINELVWMVMVLEGRRRSTARESR